MGVRHDTADPGRPLHALRRAVALATPGEHAGLPMGWHARRSLAAELDRDAAELRRTTEACFDHYTPIFDEPFPFDTYDQVFVPGLNWGAMENPGCVTYRDEMLPRGQVHDEARRLRAMVIAHEMSHMWFGDLVTQRWWDDTWLNESFADYMGFEVAHIAAGFPGTRLSFETRFKPGGYAADRRRSTHPVAPLPEDVPDVATATSNFDEISYAKGNCRDPTAGHLARRRRLPERRQRPPDPAPVRQRHPRRPGRRARRRLAARRPWLGRGVAAVRRPRHHPGRARRRGARAGAPGHPAAPPARLGLRRHDGRSRRPLGRARGRTGAAARLGRPGRGPQLHAARRSPGSSSTSDRAARPADTCSRSTDPLARGLLWTLAFDLPVEDQLGLVDRHLRRRAAPDPGRGGRRAPGAEGPVAAGPTRRGAGRARPAGAAPADRPGRWSGRAARGRAGPRARADLARRRRAAPLAERRPHRPRARARPVSCAGRWSTGWPGSASSTRTASRRSAAATAPRRATSGLRPRWPPGRQPRRRPRPGPR